MEFARQVEASLSSGEAAAYRPCVQVELISVASLESAATRYVAELKTRSDETEFLDVETAQRVGEGCLILLARHEGDSDPARHRAVQAAVSDFILQEDAESDTSIVGFDDDLRVLEATARVLG